MSRGIFILQHYSAVSLIAVAAYLFGRRLTKSFDYGSGLERIVFSTALGIGVIGYVIFFLGLAGFLYWPVVLLALVIGAALCYPVWADWPARLIRGIRTATDRRKIVVILVAVLAVILLLLPLLLLPLYPPTAFDGTMYHLPEAKIYADNHRLMLVPYLRYPVSPQQNEMLFTLALLLGDDILAHLIECLLMVLLAGTLIAFGQRVVSLRAGLWGAALLLGNPFLIWLGTSAYVEIGMMMFITLAIYGFWNWTSSRKPQWLILAGVFCGLGISTKYPAICFLLLLAMAVLYVSGKERRYSPPFIFVAVSLAAAAPWLIRNAYYTANPVFPVFSNVIGRWFGYRFWKAEYLTGLFDTTIQGFGHVGIGRSLQSLVTLPWQLTFHREAFMGIIPMSPLYLFMLPVLLVGVIKSKTIRGMAALALGYTLYWFYTIQDMRFLLPMVPILSLATAASLDLLLNWSHRVRRWLDFNIITLLISGLLFFQGWLYSFSTLWKLGPIPVTQSERDGYLTRMLPSYPAHQMLDRVAGRNYKLYSVSDENLAYYTGGVYMGDYWGPARYSLILDKLSNGMALYNELKNQGADYFLLNNRSGRWNLPRDEFFQSHFKLIYQKDALSLFELSD